MRLLSRVQVLLVAGLALVPGLPAAETARAEPSLLPPINSERLVEAGETADRQLGGRPMRGCGGGQQSVPASAIAELPRVTVSIYDGFFLPAEVTVPRGTIVAWTNRGSQSHTTTSWDRWDSGILRPGESCMAWFVTPGTYQYLSIVAADGGLMTGSVTVDTSAIGSGPSAGGSVDAVSGAAR